MAALGLIVGLSVWGQDSFEVASVKVAPHPDYNWRSNGGPGTDDPGLFTCEKCPLTVLIQFAFDLEYYKLIAPDWMPGTGYVVTARVPAGTTKDQFRRMLQDLLAERFKLVAHREKREMPVFDLLVAKGGTKLKVAEETGKESSKNTGKQQSKLGDDGFPTLPEGYTFSAIRDRFRMRDRRQTIQQFAKNLEYQVNGPVVDKTGLNGKYDIELFWAAENFSGPQETASEPRPNLFQAVQQQLGLQLVKKREPIEIIVVDRCERVPTEN
jgi:uncharacterized protein (TIGR03435 family)